MKSVRVFQLHTVKEQVKLVAQVLSLPQADPMIFFFINFTNIGIFIKISYLGCVSNNKIKNFSELHS